MESQKNNVEDGFAAFSAFSPMQNRMNFESTSSTRNQFSNKQDNLFQTLIKQAQVFEEFSKFSTPQFSAIFHHGKFPQTARAGARQDPREALQHSH